MCGNCRKALATAFMTISLKLILASSASQLIQRFPQADGARHIDFGGHVKMRGGGLTQRHATGNRLAHHREFLFDVVDCCGFAVGRFLLAIRCRQWRDVGYGPSASARARMPRSTGAITIFPGQPFAGPRARPTTGGVARTGR